MATVLTRVRFDAWPGRLVRTVRRRYNEQSVNIVTYHRVSAERSFLDSAGGPRHTPVEFERQIDYLATHYNIISLRRLVEGLEGEELPERTIVLTFDDGYADSLRQAGPILFRRRIPMTVFLATSVVGNRDLLWPHKLAWLLAHEQEDRVESALRSAGWPRVDEPIGRFVRRHYRPDIDAVLESVLQSIGKTGAGLAAELRLYVTAEEVAAAEPEFVEFGNHTHTHPVLSHLPHEMQRREIAGGREAILALTGEAPLALAYPFGLKANYNADSKRLAQETWHRAALDLRRRTNEWTTDPFDLSRKPAVSGSQRLFEQTIEDWPADKAGEAN